MLAALAARSFAPFLGSFLLLFVASGVGNGSTYRMIPAIFRVASAPAPGADLEAVASATARGRTQAAAVIGLASAVGALGGFLIPRGFGMSIAHTGSINTALWVFLAGYGICTAVTWWYYLRRSFTSFSPSLAGASI